MQRQTVSDKITSFVWLYGGKGHSWVWNLIVQSDMLKHIETMRELLSMHGPALTGGNQTNKYNYVSAGVRILLKLLTSYITFAQEVTKRLKKYCSPPYDTKKQCIDAENVFLETKKLLVDLIGCEMAYIDHLLGEAIKLCSENSQECEFETTSEEKKIAYKNVLYLVEVCISLKKSIESTGDLMKFT